MMTCFSLCLCLCRSLCLCLCLCLSLSLSLPPFLSYSLPPSLPFPWAVVTHPSIHILSVTRVHLLESVCLRHRVVVERAYLS